MYAEQVKLTVAKKEMLVKYDSRAKTKNRSVKIYPNLYCHNFIALSKCQRLFKEQTLLGLFTF